MYLTCTYRMFIDDFGIPQRIHLPRSAHGKLIEDVLEPLPHL